MHNLQRANGSEHNAVPADEAEFSFIDTAGDSAALKQDENWRTKGVARKPLVRYPDFRITLIAIRSGARIDEHHNPGRISVQTIEGHIRMRAAGQTFEMPQGRVLVLDRAVRHDVEAIEDSVFLLTAALPEHQPTT